MGILDVFYFKALINDLLLLNDSLNHCLNLKFYQQARQIVEKHSTWVIFFIMKRSLLIGKRSERIGL